MQHHNALTQLCRPTFMKVAIVMFLAAGLGHEMTAVGSGPTSKKVALHQPMKSPTKAKASTRSPPTGNAIHTLAPKGIYVVVDTAQNTVFVREGEKILHMAVASTGSGASLKDPRNPDKGWVFETPRGVYTILSKIKNPAWVKPDWAFIEEGEPIPTKSQDRVETGMLGDYALGFGNGYFIHGTLYTRMLGTNVTHGCIRLGDKDLEYLYRHVPTGATLIIF